MLFISPDIAIALSSMICINQESIFSSPFWNPYLQHSGFPSRMTVLEPNCSTKPVLAHFRGCGSARPYSPTAAKSPHLSWHSTTQLQTSTLFKSFTIYSLSKRKTLMLYSKTSARGNRKQEFVFPTHRSASIEPFRRLWKLLLDFETSLFPRGDHSYGLFWILPRKKNTNHHTHISCINTTIQKISTNKELI